MRILGSAFRALGVVLALATTVAFVWPQVDDSGAWTTNPWISSAVGLLGVAVALLCARALSQRRLKAASLVALATLPVAWAAYFLTTYDWYTSDGGTCANGPCGATPELVSGGFAAYTLFVAALAVAALARRADGTRTSRRATRDG
jgi:hypothetical protein